MRDKLKIGASQLSIDLNSKQLDELERFLSLLSKWNRVYNLTSVRSTDEMVGRHILDSLSVLSYLPDASTTASAKPVFDVLDVGTGAGLPVIPLAILRPDLTFLSVESNGKKTRFQHQATLELGLSNVQVKQARIEDVESPAATIVSRAFSAPEKFLDAVAKNCTDTARVIIMLGTKDKMPDDLPTGFSLKQVTQVQVPYCDAERHIAIVDSL